MGKIAEDWKSDDERANEAAENENGGKTNQ